MNVTEHKDNRGVHNQMVNEFASNLGGVVKSVFPRKEASKMANSEMPKITLWVDDRDEVDMIDAKDGNRQKRFHLRDYPDYGTMVGAVDAWLDEGERHDLMSAQWN